MNTEYDEGQEFFAEVGSTEHVWLAMQDNNIHMNKDGDGTIILFVWSGETRTQDFLDQVKSDNLSPVSWAIDDMIELLKQIPQIEAIAVNLTGQSQQILTYNVDEFTKQLSNLLSSDEEIT